MADSALTPQLKSRGARAPDLDHLQWLSRYVFGADPQGAAWNGISLLDLGCGSGFLCAEAQSHGAAHVVGIDLCPPEAPTTGWRFVTADLDQPTWADKVPKAADRTFDVICAFDILEHLASPVHFLGGCRALLKAGGKLILTTPNTVSWERFLRGEKWSGATDLQHKVLFTRYSLEFLLRRTGLKPKVLRAPVRSIDRLGLAFPQIGAQILCVAELG